ncbi:MAG: hypothetical protein JWO89_1348, partial [Verrucomicrobiaceae bacterium]|nr:hypothetical protein [Verrucomicrobiaceae bacterium]
VIGLIAAIVAVAWQQVIRSSPLVDESYVRTTKQEPVAANTWSGRTQSEPPQLDAMRLDGHSVPSRDAAKLIGKTVLPKAVPLVSGIEDIENKRDQISKVVQAFLAARIVAGKLPFVREPERVKPLMDEYYAREPMPQIVFRSLGKMVRVEESGYRFGYVQVLLDTVSPVTLIIEERTDGNFRLDWECLVRYGELAWTDFLRLKPEEPRLMRVKASRPASPPPNGSKAEWIELRHSVDSGTVLACFNRDDPLLVSLVSQLNQGNWKDVPLTLRLSFLPPTDQASGDKTLISGVEGKGWLILNGSAH